MDSEDAARQAVGDELDGADNLRLAIPRGMSARSTPRHSQSMPASSAWASVDPTLAIVGVMGLMRGTER
ncbi:MAG: hypothetical protein ACR2ND_03510 [Solirubrobacteraceae bacterium]